MSWKLKLQVYEKVWVADSTRCRLPVSFKIHDFETASFSCLSSILSNLRTNKSVTSAFAGTKESNLALHYPNNSSPQRLSPLVKMLAVSLADVARNYSESSANDIKDVFCNHIFVICVFRECVQSLTDDKNVTGAIVYKCTQSKRIQKQHTFRAFLARYASYPSAYFIMLCNELLLCRACIECTQVNLFKVLSPVFVSKTTT